MRPIQTPTGNKALLQQQSRQSHRPAGATLIVNHVYRSLPQTPLISGASPSVLHHHLGQQELLLGDHRRRSYGGEKGQIQAELARPVVSMMASSRPDDESEEPLVRHDDDDADRLNDNGNSAGRSRFKFRPLVTSKSSENFQQLRRVAMAAVNRIFTQAMSYLVLVLLKIGNVFSSRRLPEEIHLCPSNYSVTSL